MKDLPWLLLLVIAMASLVGCHAGDEAPSALAETPADPTPADPPPLAITPLELPGGADTQHPRFFAGPGGPLRHSWDIASVMKPT